LPGQGGPGCPDCIEAGPRLEPNAELELLDYGQRPVRVMQIGIADYQFAQLEGGV